jgi:phosphatidylglycerophosphatase A
MSTSMAMLRDPGHLLALGFGSGLMPKGPGTAGTIVGVAIYWSLAGVSQGVFLTLVAVAFVVGIWLCGRTAATLGVHDHPAIVWDEIVGYLFTMAFVEPGILAAILGFIAFRVFDIFKPWPIGLLDRRIHGGFGIMLDDLLAAGFAIIILAFIEYLSYI